MARVDQVKRGAELAQGRLDQLVEHLLLALEIDVEAGLRNADARGDLPRRDILDAMLQEQSPGALEGFAPRS